MSDTGCPLRHGRPEHSEIMTGKCLTTDGSSCFLPTSQMWGRERGHSRFCAPVGGHCTLCKQKAGQLHCLLFLTSHWQHPPTQMLDLCGALEMPAAICKACDGLNCAPPLNSHVEVLTPNVSGFGDSISTEVIKVK